MTENKDVTAKFTMEDVDSAHMIKPYLPKKYFLKKFGYLNYKISKGWDMERIVKLIQLMNKEEENPCESEQCPS